MRVLYIIDYNFFLNETFDNIYSNNLQQLIYLFLLTINHVRTTVYYDKTYELHIVSNVVQKCQCTWSLIIRLKRDTGVVYNQYGRVNKLLR